MNILVPKISALQLNPKTKWQIFSKTVTQILIKFDYFLDTLSLNKTAWAISSGK
jgi:hypothetical protein